MIELRGELIKEYINLPSKSVHMYDYVPVIYIHDREDIVQILHQQASYC